jgi:hypothetical protein
MPTMTTEQAREKKIDEILASERAERDEQARAAVRARCVEEERLSREAEEYAAQHAKQTAYLARAEAAYPQACKQYKVAVDAFREARLRLWALDTILNHSGGFSDANMGLSLRHARAADAEGDLHLDLGAAVAAMRRTLEG